MKSKHSESENEDGILFECQACREQPCAPSLDDLSAWAKLCGYDSSCIRLLEEWDEHEWGEVTEISGWLAKFGGLNSLWSARRLRVAAVQPPFFNATPEAGKSYVACVHHPFIAKETDHFWFLFQPSFSLIYGWDNCPEEIYSSHLLHVAFNHVLHRGEKFALIVVTVQEMISVPAIHKVLPETSGEKPFGMFDNDFARRSWWERWLSYIFVYWDPDSDEGAWWLFRQDDFYVEEPRFRLVLLGHRGWHDALVWGGNHRLSATEAEQLNSFMRR
ncbi:MAG: hypothetical protein U1F71_17985 [Verrucomicrobiaceae bacterium]